MSKINLGVVSLGCNKTLVDTQNLLGSLSKIINIVDENSADFILLNTCSFLKSARNEVIENIKLFENKKVILVGCYTKFAESDIFEKFPQVYAVIPTNKYKEIESILKAVIKGKKIFFDFEIEKEYLEMPESKRLTLKHVAYVKISEGCNNTCTYCTIPKIRGKFRSRKPEFILHEVKNLINDGCKEIILTSQDTGYYGLENKDSSKYDFTSLLKDIIKIKGDFKVRFLYMYPERINENLLKLIKENEKIIPYFDIPFQHCSKEILIKMKRPFGEKSLGGLVEKIRTLLPNSIIRTTFIVGFPGEKEKHFNELIKFIKKYKFERIGIFSYSNEKGAESYNYKDQIPEKIKKSRLKKLYEIAKEISLKNNIKLFKDKKELDCTVDNYDINNKYYIGRSYRECIEVDPVINIISDKKLKNGDVVKIKIVGYDEYNLYGEVI